ncbi:MAG: FAD-dependent oxidoreductase [Gammaproteobacteria bacterium]|nr:FAD-dependent oxidoreductase [Gammaproteobacteria bacterium]
MPELTDYAIIGAGPAALCAIPTLIAHGVHPSKITWIDNSGFNAGAFGSELSLGSSVPGNTSVESYQKVNSAIYKILTDYKPKKDFTINTLPLDNTCPLKIAAEPMQDLTNYLRTKVISIPGTVNNIITINSGIKITLTLANNLHQNIIARKCILAVGATPKIFKLPENYQNLTIINNPNILFTKSRLKEYLAYLTQNNLKITHFAVIGSSHSAALAIMNLLEAGISVKQFMNKPYKFAQVCTSPDGIKYTKHDNTGLKGDVAAYTKKLLNQDNKKNYQIYLGYSQEEIHNLIIKHLYNCSHIIATIGYQTANTLLINNCPLDQFTYNNQTTEFHQINNLFGIGIGFPLQVTAPDGEVEFAVGYGKFWNAVNNPQVLKAWGH